MRKLIRAIVVLGVVLLPLRGLAQVVTAPIPPVKMQFLDANGSPLSAGCVFSYDAGSSTPRATYADSTGSTLNSNPLILDAGGFGSIWLGPQKYKISVYSAGGISCASGTLQYTVDGISSSNLPLTGSVVFTAQAAPTCNAADYKLWADSGSTFIKMCNNGTIDTVAGVTSTQTLTNKTLTSPTINSGTFNTSNLTGATTAVSLNSILFADQFAGSDLGAKIKAAIAAGGTYIQLAPNASYTMTTQVNTAVVGTFIDCNGSTIDASALNVPYFIWSYTVTGTAADFEHAPTGIKNCKFIGSAANTSAYVGQVLNISYFQADNIRVSNGGAFDIEGESILNDYKDVRVYLAANPNVWKTAIGTGSFGPNATIIDHPYCEQGVTTGITCFDITSGSITIRNPYVEAVTTGIHLNGTGSVVLSGGDFGFRLYDMTGILIDAVGVPTESSIHNVVFSMGGAEAKLYTAVTNNVSGMHLNMTGNTFDGSAAAGATCTAVLTTQQVYLTFSGNKVRSLNASCPFSILNLSGATGKVEQGIISSNNFVGDIGSTFNFVTPAAAGSVGNASIAGNQFSRMTSFIQLGLATTTTTVVGNTFVGTCPTITFLSSSSSFIGNDSPTGGCTVTLAGSRSLGNPGFTQADELPSFTTTSTTPVANLNASLVTYNAAGTQQTNTHAVIDTCTLGTSCAVTLAGAAVFTSSSSYKCGALDTTSAGAIKIVYTSGSAFTLTGTGTDVLHYVCIGN